MSMPSFKFTDLDSNEVNYILSMLNDRPRKEVNGLCQKLELQVQQQVAAFNTNGATKIGGPAPPAADPPSVVQ
jgi:hypothetical protein